jgi:hypothetical protein
MELIRTTIRLEPVLKKSAEMKAVELDMSFQELCAQALAEFLDKSAQEKATKLTFLAQPLGEPLDHLTREDLYAD